MKTAINLKWNWGWGIALFYTAFAGMLFLALVKSRDVERSLVQDNYYEEDLRYEQKMDKLRSAAALGTSLDMAYDITNQRYIINFPGEIAELKGEVRFYKPNDQSLDFVIPLLEADVAGKSIDVSTLESGKWKVILDFSSNGQAYIREKELLVP